MDRVTVYLRVAVYIVIYGVGVFLSARLLVWLGGYFLGVTSSQFLCAIAANWLTLRIYTQLRLADMGLWLTRESMWNLGVGIAGGMGAAGLVLLPPLLFKIAQLVPAPGAPGAWTILFTVAILFAGSAGEEILFRGYAFQLLLGVWGPSATVFTVGALFASLHGANPNSTWLAIGNTAGFGILFGYAFLRSRDLWLPIGLHFGWNLALPLFGVNVSGLTMKLTAYEMKWSASAELSGGDYGPEGSILTTIVLAALALYVWKAPVRGQKSEVPACVPGSFFPS